jgi:hypothetical protein
MIECDEGGASFATGMTKAQAVQSAIELVMDYCGTMEVLNRNPEENTGVCG